MYETHATYNGKRKRRREIKIEREKIKEKKNPTDTKKNRTRHDNIFIDLMLTTRSNCVQES